MISLLNQTLDSLDLRLYSHSLPSVYINSNLKEWREYKENFDYSKNDEPFYVDFPSIGRFKLLHIGHPPYEFVFENEEIGQIYLLNPDKFSTKFSKNTGQIFINYRSKFLQCQTDDYGLVDEINQNLYSLTFADMLSTYCKVSRVDLAVDCGAVSFGWQDLSKLCTRSRKKDGLSSFCTLKDLESVRTILFKLRPQIGNKGGCNDSKKKSTELPLLTSQQIDILLELTRQAIDDPSMSRAIFGQDLETAYIGRFASKIYARIYRKSNEIKVSGKDYLEAYWKEKGWQEGDSVWRTEFSLSGDFLKEFLVSDLNNDDFIAIATNSYYSGEDKTFKEITFQAYTDCGTSLHDWHNFKNNIHRLWTYCTQDWLRHTTAENSLNSRSPNSEYWDCVTTAFVKDRNFCRLPLPAPPTVSLAQQLIAQASGCLKTAIALSIGGFNRAFGNGEYWHDQEEIIPIMVSEISKDLIHDINLNQIHERRSRYGCDEFSDTAFTAALRQHRMKLGRGS